MASTSTILAFILLTFFEQSFDLAFYPHSSKLSNFLHRILYTVYGMEW